MSLGKLLLLLLLIAVVVILGLTGLFAVLGTARGRSEQWARNAFTASVGVIFITAVLVAAGYAIRGLNHLQTEPIGALTAAAATPSVSFDATGERVETEAVAYTTPEPGTIIRSTPEPERITGVNYGADFDLIPCNDYVYVTETAEVRAGPGDSYESIGSMTAGTTVKRIGYDDAWSLVDYYNNYAFVSNDALIVTE